MIAVLVLVAATGFLVVGVVRGELEWTWVALGLAAAVLAAIALAARPWPRSARGADSSARVDSDEGPSDRTTAATSDGPTEDSVPPDREAGGDGVPEAVEESPAEQDRHAPRDSGSDTVAGGTDAR